jgi:HlyD family secretion protein
VRKSKVLIPLVLVLAASGGTWWWYEGRQPESADELVVFGNVDIREARLSFNGSEHVGAMYVDEGDRVTEGQLLATLHTERLEATRNRAQAEVGVSQARAAAAESTFRRIASLADGDLASEEERDESEAAYKAEQALADTELYAPADGVIRERILEPGDMASPLTPVFTLALMDPVWVRAYLPETVLGRVRLGATASITTDSFPEKVYKGWIGYIAPTAEFTPKNVETTELRTRLVYRMRVFACNPAGELRLGMPATVRLDLTATDTPGAAVCDDG